MFHSLRPVVCTLLIDSLLFVALEAHAGTYIWTNKDANGNITAQSPVYSGGTFTYTGAARGNNPGGQLLPFAFNSADGYYEDTITNGCVPDAQGRATTCSTTLTGSPLTAKFIWQPAYPGEPPPSSVVVCQNGYAEGFTQYSAGNCVITYKCNDGLGSSSSGSAPSICKDTKWSVQSPSGDGSVTLTCTSSSAFTGNSGTVGQNGSPPCANGIVWLGYSASVYPVTITLSGTTKDSSGNLNILIGQNCTPYLSIPGLPSAITVGWPTWSVSGDTYTSFDIGSGQNTGQAIPFPDPNANISVAPPVENPTFFWKSENIVTGRPETVQGYAILYTDPAGGLSPNPNVAPSSEIGAVTASKTVQVQRPDLYSSPKDFNGAYISNPLLGTVGIDTSTTSVISNDPSGNISGYDLQIAVVTPDLFTQGETKFGNWGWLQLCQLDVTQGGTGTQMAAPELDSSFPYNPGAGAANGVPGETYDAKRMGNNPIYYEFTDSPFEQYNNYSLHYDTTLSFDNNFGLYVMYEPPDAGNGVNYVPIDLYKWEFGASMTRPSLNGSWTPNPPGTMKDLGNAPYPSYPSWTSKFTP